MGKFVTPNRYFFLPKTVKSIMETEKQKVDTRFNKLEEELEKLKKGMNNASEAGSCHWENQAFEDEPMKELVLLDAACYLAVDVRSNIVAKGSIMQELKESNTEVMLDIALQGQAKLPIPIEEKFIFEVNDAVGHILSWPRHLVIRCSELEKCVEKNTRKKPNMLKVKESDKGYEKKEDKRLTEDDERKNEDEIKKEENEEMKHDEGIEKMKAIVNEEEKVKRKKPMMNEEENVVKRRNTRGQMKVRIRVQENVAMKMTAIMVDGKLSAEESIKVQCHDDLFGAPSFT